MHATAAGAATLRAAAARGWDGLPAPLAAALAEVPPEGPADDAALAEVRGALLEFRQAREIWPRYGRDMAEM